MQYECISSKAINKLIEQNRNQEEANKAIKNLQDFKNGLIQAMRSDGKVCDYLLTKLENHKNISFINITRFTPNNNYNKTKTATQDTLNTVKEALEKYLALTKNTLTLIVFDEMFWSQEKPLKDRSDDENEITKSKIDAMIKELSQRYRNAFFVVNYLYKSDIVCNDIETFQNYLKNNDGSFAMQSFTENIVMVFKDYETIMFNTCNNVNPLYAASKSMAETQDKMQNFIYSINRLVYLCLLEYLTKTDLSYKIGSIFNHNNITYVSKNDTDTAYALIKRYINTKLSVNYKSINSAQTKRLQNQTIIIHNGNELIEHNKHGYFNEDNDGILSKHSIYIPGDGYNHDGSNFDIEQKTATYLRDNLGIAICLDLNLGKNMHNEFKASNNATNQEKLLLIQSNHIEIFDANNIINLPDDIIISHSDTKLLLSYYHKMNEETHNFHQVQYSAGYNFLHFKKDNNLLKLLYTTIGDTYICKKYEDYVNITLGVLNLTY